MAPSEDPNGGLSFVIGLGGALMTVGVLSLIALMVLAALGGQQRSPVAGQPPAVVSDLNLQPMLDGHAAKIQRLQAASPDPRMVSVVLFDPMRRDWSSWMVTEQEAYMAQLARMVGRR